MIYFVGTNIVSRPRPLPVVVALRARENPRDPLVGRLYLGFTMAERVQYFEVLEADVVKDAHNQTFSE